jgi:hypothetical protein
MNPMSRAELSGHPTMSGVVPTSVAASFLHAANEVDAKLFELWAERRAAANEEIRVSDAAREALNRAGASAADRRLDIEADIFNLAPTPNTIAAAILIELAYVCNGWERLDRPSDGAIIADRSLGKLRPLLSGIIAGNVGELLDNPSTPIRSMAFWPHDPAIGADRGTLNSAEIA